MRLLKKLHLENDYTHSLLKTFIGWKKRFASLDNFFVFGTMRLFLEWKVFSFCDSVFSKCGFFDVSSKIKSGFRVLLVSLRVFFGTASLRKLVLFRIFKTLCCFRILSEVSTTAVPVLLGQALTNEFWYKNWVQFLLYCCMLLAITTIVCFYISQKFTIDNHKTFIWLQIRREGLYEKWLMQFVNNKQQQSEKLTMGWTDAEIFCGGIYFFAEVFS